MFVIYIYTHTHTHTLCVFDAAIFKKQRQRTCCCQLLLLLWSFIPVNVDEKWTKCGETALTQTEGIVTSPLYPRNYPPNTQCVWTISAQPGRTIFLRYSFSNWCYKGDLVKKKLLKIVVDKFWKDIL